MGKNIKIGVDAGCLGVEDERLKAGVYQVALNLLKELGKLDKENIYYLYSFYPIPKTILRSFGPNFRNVVVKPQKGWSKVWLPLRMVKDKPSLFLALNQAMPFINFIPTIGFVHGLNFDEESYLDKGVRERLNRETKNLITHARKIVTVSHYLKEQIALQYSRSDVEVAYPGIGTSFTPKGKKMVFEDPYFLFVGSFKRSKNIPIMLKGFSHFLKKLQRNYKMVLIGSDYWLEKDIEEAMSNPDIKKNILILKNIPHDELSKYYRGAEAFVSVSTREGFGLPFAEAMGCGCPVIGSTVDAIPEIVQDAGILVKPTDNDALTKAMIDISTNSTLRKKLIDRGVKRSKNYNWEKFGRSIYTLIESLSKNKHV